MYSGQEWSVGQKVLRASENGSVYLVPIRMVFTNGSNWRTCQESRDREDGGITNQHTHTTSWPTRESEVPKEHKVLVTISVSFC